MNLLLVCCDPIWTEAVRAAAHVTGGGLSRCDARAALTHLAGAGGPYSHLLVHASCADGLADAFAELTSEAAGDGTEMLMLGGVPAPPRHAGVIPFATCHAVRAALMPRQGPRSISRGALPLAELRAALDDAMVGVRYQPIVRINDRAPIALEVLARLDHPDRGIVLPDCFVPQIEDAGLAARLTDLVVERTFADMAGPHLKDCTLPVTVNVPLDVLLHPSSIDRMDARRIAAGIPAHRVILELTERMPVTDFHALRLRLDDIRARGYRVVADDIAPAVPGLASLMSMPFSTLKLDKNLAGQLNEDSAVEVFLRTIVRDAHARDMNIVAEGVETATVWRRMQDFGVDGAQGFLIARPLPIAAVPVWLETWPGRASFD